METNPFKILLGMRRRLTVAVLLSLCQPLWSKGGQTAQAVAAVSESCRDFLRLVWRPNLGQYREMFKNLKREQVGEELTLQARQLREREECIAFGLCDAPRLIDMEEQHRLARAHLKARQRSKADAMLAQWHQKMQGLLSQAPGGCRPVRQIAGLSLSDAWAGGSRLARASAPLHPENGSR